MRINIILPLTILIFLTGCGAVNINDNVEARQPHENSESEHKLYDKTFETELVKDDDMDFTVNNARNKEKIKKISGIS